MSNLTPAFSSAYDLTVKYDHVKYGFGDKNPDSGEIDCSGWVAYLQDKTLKEANTYLGQEIFTKADLKLNDSGAAYQIDAIAKDTGILLTGDKVTKDALKEGMIIGEDNGAKDFDKGRPRGIDHIVQVVKDPKTGELMISQSHGGKGGGVDLMPVDQYLEHKQNKGVKLYLTDPLSKARDLIEQKQQQDMGIKGADLYNTQHSLNEKTLTNATQDYNADVLTKTTAAVNDLCDARGYPNHGGRDNMACHLASDLITQGSQGTGKFEAALGVDGKTISVREQISEFKDFIASADSNVIVNIPKEQSLAKIAAYEPLILAQNSPTHEREISRGRSL